MLLLLDFQHITDQSTVNRFYQLHYLCGHMVTAVTVTSECKDKSLFIFSCGTVLCEFGKKSFLSLCSRKRQSRVNSSSKG